MKMTEERLQEIKTAWEKGLLPTSVVSELIAAYENQGELLQLSLANVDRLNEELVEANELYDIAEEGRVLFMNQLGELTPEYASERMVDLLRDIADLRKQLAVLLEREKRMQAEHSISTDNYEKQLAALEGSNHVLHKHLSDSRKLLDKAQAELAEIRKRVVPTEEEAYHTLNDYEDLWVMERKYASDKEPGSDIWCLLRTINLAWSHNYEDIKTRADLRKQLAEAQAECRTEPEKGHFGIGHKPSTEVKNDKRDTIPV